jgi:hypothetical protein
VLVTSVAFAMSLVALIIMRTMSIAVGLVSIPMIALVTTPVVMTVFPVIVTAFSMRIGFAHGFVTVFVPVFMAMLMAVALLLPVKISQVISAFLLAIMAVSLFADFLICMTMFGQFMVLSILGFIRVGQRACRRHKEQNEWADQYYFHS